MPDNSKKFHEFALRTSLFKGRADWYFCYLKSEKIAHVLSVLLKPSDGQGGVDIFYRAAELPQTVVHVAAGEVDVSVALADVFGLLSDLRIAASTGTISKEAAALLCKEYEGVAERLVTGSHPSPFVTADDFRLAPLPELDSPLAHAPLHVKDIKDTKKMSDTPQSERVSLILGFIKKNRQASIKEIAAVVKGCSEKTIQRELGTLIERGLVRKVGERRWSMYVPA